MQMKDEISNWEAAILSSFSQTNIHTNLKYTFIQISNKHLHKFEIYIHTNMKFTVNSILFTDTCMSLLACPFRWSMSLSVSWKNPVVDPSVTVVNIHSAINYWRKSAISIPPRESTRANICVEHPGNWTQVKHLRKHR